MSHRFLPATCTSRTLSRQSGVRRGGVRPLSGADRFVGPGVRGIVQDVSGRPWRHSGQGDQQPEFLPAVVILEPEYGAELPLASEEGMLGWEQTGLSPELLDRLMRRVNAPDLGASRECDGL